MVDVPRQNCWEYKRCGRQPGGPHVQDLGECPAATKRGLDGAHGGRCAGRACWVVVGTLCDGKVQGTFAAKIASCEKCDFYLKVRRDEGVGFQFSAMLLKQLREAG
ncbi:MAG: two-CW domain-containing protein [Pseudomonadota bacterium]